MLAVPNGNGKDIDDPDVRRKTFQLTLDAFRGFKIC